ncbi:MAG: UvrB/UvrC motif-containing protein, partial [Bacteroidia bacterium]
IYTYKNILDDAGVEYENQDDELDEPSHIAEEKVKPAEPNSLNSMTISQLNKELEKAIQLEDYDYAAVLRDEINTRK